VPKPLADFVILEILRRSAGTAISVSDDALLAAARELSRAAGICACPEGGACLAATRQLAGSGWIRADERVVIFNTGSGLKYAEVFSSRES
jgi:threonine synthase